MFNIIRRTLRRSRASTKLRAISQVQGWVEFTPDGTILDASPRFLALVGYSAAELIGRHHRMLCAPAFAASAEYGGLWARLRRGETDAGVYPRVAKDGRTIWIQASYNPVRGPFGRVSRIVKFATDVTAERTRLAAVDAQMEAVDRSQATIEFAIDGTIRRANANFLATMGYALDEIVGRHHSMFADPAFAASREYADFWRRLRAGEAFTGSYRRLGKGGREVWIQATYSPLLDADGVAYGVIKVASDITAQTQAKHELEALVAEAQHVLGAMTDGDLTQRMRGDYHAELQSLAANINAAVATLHDTLEAVDVAARFVADASGQLTDGNADMARRTAAQASSLREATASLAEITGTARRSAESAKTADEIGVLARTTAEKGGAVTREAVDAMSRILESSRRIAEISGVIDGIAFQTNLLALNAAVEAARAGDHGRGFAVVAEEVRALSKRSANASQEIRTLVDDTLARVADGHRLVGETGVALGEIVDEVRQLTTLMAEISEASRQQAQGVTLVSDAVTAIDHTTRENTALIGQIAGSAQALRDEANRLRDRVASFRLATGEGALEREHHDAIFGAAGSFRAHAA